MVIILDPRIPVLYAATPNEQPISYATMTGKTLLLYFLIVVEDYIFLATNSIAITLRRLGSLSTEPRDSSPELPLSLTSAFDREKLFPLVNLPTLVKFIETPLGFEILNNIMSKSSSEGDLALLIAVRLYDKFVYSQLSKMDKTQILLVLESHKNFTVSLDVKDTIGRLCKAWPRLRFLVIISRLAFSLISIFTPSFKLCYFESPRNSTRKSWS